MILFAQCKSDTSYYDRKKKPEIKIKYFMYLLFVKITKGDYKRWLNNYIICWKSLYSDISSIICGFRDKREIYVTTKRTKSEYMYIYIYIYIYIFKVNLYTRNRSTFSDIKCSLQNDNLANGIRLWRQRGTIWIIFCFLFSESLRPIISRVSHCAIYAY